MDKSVVPQRRLDISTFVKVSCKSALYESEATCLTFAIQI